MEISDILFEIAELLEVCEYSDLIKAVRLKQWANDLRLNNSPEQRAKTLIEVKNVIAGMNSLSDIYLMPAVYSKYSKDEANYKLNCLIRDLDDQIHDALKKGVMK